MAIPEYIHPVWDFLHGAERRRSKYVSVRFFCFEVCEVRYVHADVRSVKEEWFVLEDRLNLGLRPTWSHIKVLLLRYSSCDGKTADVLDPTSRPPEQDSSLRELSRASSVSLTGRTACPGILVQRFTGTLFVRTLSLVIHILRFHRGATSRRLISFAMSGTVGTVQIYPSGYSTGVYYIVISNVCCFEVTLATYSVSSDSRSSCRSVPHGSNSRTF